MNKPKFYSKNRCIIPKIDENFRSSDDCDISHKIKSLESEGERLRSQVEEILHETNQLQSSRASVLTLDSCATVCDNSETYDLRNGNLKKGDIKSNYLARRSKCGDYSKNIMNTELEEYKQHIESLQQQHKQDSFAHQLEKERLSDVINELKRVNYRLQDDNERRSKEFKTMDSKYSSMIERMRNNLSELLSVNQKQEEALAETGEKLQHIESIETFVKAGERLRDLLTEIEYYRGATLVKDYDIESCDPNVLVDIVENCFKEYNCDLESRSRKIKDLEEEMVQFKRTMSHDKEVSLQELRRELECVHDENNCLKLHIDEINESASQEIEKLREEKSNIHMKMEDDMVNASRIINGLERDLQELSHKNRKLNENNIEEKKSFESILDGNEKQIVIIRSERDQAVNQKSSITAKLDATQSQLSETETSLLQLQSDKYRLEKEVESLKKCAKDMEDSIRCSRKYFGNIIKAINTCNSDVETCNSNYENSHDLNMSENESDSQNQVWKPKKYQIEEAIHQIKSLGKREQICDSKYETLKKEFDSIVKQLEVVDHQRRNIEQSFKTQQLQIDNMTQENVHIKGLVANRNNEIERLTSERNYYFQMLNETTEELTAIKNEKHRLVISLSTKFDLINVSYNELEERCKLLESQKNVNDSNAASKPNIIDTSLAQNDILKEERKGLIAELKEIKIAYEEMSKRHGDEQLTLQNLRRENGDLQTNLRSVQREHDELLADNKRMMLKFKDSEREIINLCRELQNNNGIKSKKHVNLEKKVTDLVTELSSTKGELKIAQEKIKYIHRDGSKSNLKTSTDMIMCDFNETVPVADNYKITKSRLRNLEQQMLSLETTQKHLKDENHKLTDLLNKITSQNERMSEELENYVDENTQLRAKVRLLNVESTHHQEKNERILKKINDKSDYKSEYIDFNDNERDLDHAKYGYSKDNTECIKQLRGDLQDSIKEARRLLSNTPSTSSNDDKLLRKESPCRNYKTVQLSKSKPKDIYQRLSINERYNGSNNNNVHKTKEISLSDVTDSSVVESGKPETSSLTEVDRHLSLPMNNFDKKSDLDQNTAYVTIPKLSSPTVKYCNYQAINLLD